MMTSSATMSADASMTMCSSLKWCRRLESNQPSTRRRVYSPPEVPASASARWWSGRELNPDGTVCKTGPRPDGQPHVGFQRPRRRPRSQHW